MTPGEWESFGYTLRDVRRWWKFAAGDWYWFARRKAEETGSARWGELYTQAAAILDISVESLMDIASVAKRVPSPQRNQELSHSHHMAVTAYAEQPEEQTEWLERAESNHWSVGRLREEIRVARGEPKPINACLECQRWLQAVGDGELCIELAIEQGWKERGRYEYDDEAWLAAVVYLSKRFNYMAIRTGEE